MSNAVAPLLFCWIIAPRVMLAVSAALFFGGFLMLRALICYLIGGLLAIPWILYEIRRAERRAEDDFHGHE